MCRSDVNARRQLLKNPIKPRQERQNSRFKLLPEVRERCQKSKKIDARAYVNEGSLQGRSRWPKPFQNPSQNRSQTLPNPSQKRWQNAIRKCVVWLIWWGVWIALIVWVLWIVLGSLNYLSSLDCPRPRQRNGL